MSPLEVLGILLVWVAPSCYVAKLAERKEYDFGVFVLFSLLLSWPLMLFVVIFTEDNGDVDAPDPADRIQGPADPDPR